MSVTLSQTLSALFPSPINILIFIAILLVAAILATYGFILIWQGSHY